MVSTVEKMFDRIPVESTIICNAIVFNPAKMIATQTDELQKKAKSLLTKFINLNILTQTACDQILKEYKEYCFSREKFSNYDKQKDRLDTFFFSLPAIKKYVNLAFVIKMILTLSHGQAAVERSFSINKSVVDVNMKEESIVARKAIKDHMLSNDIQPDMIEISNKMINFYRSARQKYEIHKEREAEKKKKKDKSIQQQILEEEIKDTTEKSNQLLETEKMLDKEFVETIKQAEGKEVTLVASLVTKANALKRHSEECAEEREKLKEALKVLQDKRKKLE